MKFLIILAACIVATMGQKSPYAFSTGTKIQLAARFRTDEDLAQQNNDLDIRTRFGAGDAVSSTIRPLPVDALGDANLVREIESWPRDKQPFWFLNYKQIEAARSRPQAQIAPRTRSSFASVDGDNRFRK